MQPVNQAQHKIPQVYLKRFGYLTPNKQWKVSVLQGGENFTRQKNVKSFTATTNIFDIESDDPNLVRIFEELNCDYETEYNNILNELEQKGELSDRHYSYLLQIIANLICRSDYWRNIVIQMMEVPEKVNFVKVLIGHHFPTYEEFEKIDEKPFFKMLLALPPEKAANRVLIYFAEHILHRLWHYDIVFIQSDPDKPWFTSTNPVVMHNRTAHIEIMAKESELYFPLSPKYLAYLHYAGSDDKDNELRQLEKNKIHQATEEQNISIQKHILDNFADYIIVAGELRYRSEIQPNRE